MRSSGFFCMCWLFFQSWRRQNTHRYTHIFYMFLKKGLCLVRCGRWVFVQSKPLSLTFVLSKPASRYSSCCKRAGKWRKRREQRGDKQGRERMKWQLCPAHHRIGDTGVVCLLTSLSLKNRVFAIKQPLTFPSLRLLLFLDQHDTSLVCCDNYRATLSFLLGVVGWYRTSGATQYLTSTV